MTAAAWGAWAEGIALQYLEDHGLVLVTRNFRCKLGELDLVMTHRKELVFVEVRLRNNTSYGDGLVSVSYAKQRRLARAASVFLMRHPDCQERRCRFDVVSVSKRNYRAHCEWIQGAFS